MLFKVEISSIKKIFFLIISVFFLICCDFYFWYKRPGLKKDSIEFYIPPHISRENFFKNLEEKDLIDRFYFFEFLLKIKKTYGSLKSGFYEIPPFISPQKLLDMFESQKTTPKIIMEFTIPEGLTIKGIYQRIQLLNYPYKKKFQESLENDLFLKSLLGFPVKTLEGFFYPTTYLFFDDWPEPSIVLTSAVKEFFKRLPKDYEQKLLEYNLSLFEAVTFASLIEKETALEEEKPMVSEVIWNRMKKKQPLAIDASIIYGVDDFNGDLKSKHLKDIKNLYNTRIHIGLPPGPICNPSESSLRSVFQPTKYGYYYYVVKSKGEKKHVFSKTLQEHNKNVRHYVKSLKEKS